MLWLEILLGVVVVVLAATVAVLRRRLVAARAEVERLRRRPTERRILGVTPSGAVRSVVGTAMKVRDQGLGGAIRSSIDDLALWADVERPDLARLAATDGTVTIVFSDIEDSTALNHRLGDRGWVRLLARHDRLLKAAISAHAGQVVKTQGDGFMVAFGEGPQAVAAALEIQQRLARVRTRSPLHGVRVRIGAHTGSAVHRGGDLFGRNVAQAARVAAQADGGEVLVSDATLETLSDDLVQVVETREAELKGVPGTHLLHVLQPAS